MSEKEIRRETIEWYREEIRKADDPLCRWDKVILRERYARALEKLIELMERNKELEWLEAETVRSSLAGDGEIGG